jgi:hypothetical protein
MKTGRRGMKKRAMTATKRLIATNAMVLNGEDPFLG